MCSIILFAITLLFNLSFGNKNQLQISTGNECLRSCTKNEEPKICYYHFAIEFYSSNGLACQFCKPTTAQTYANTTELCQCVLADGVEKTVISTNRMVPGPQINVCKNDYIVVDVENIAEGLEATIHWHGIFQNKYQYYDGVPYITQCPISSFSTFRYQFQVEQSGTFFWHSHVAVHRLDGQYGALVVREPVEDDPNSDLYDQDDPAHVILISDWLHQLAADRFPGLRQRWHSQSAENILINGRGNYIFPNGTATNIELETFYVTPGARYRFRLINSFTTVCLSQLNIEDHPLLIIAQDGSNIKPVYVNTIITGSGERVDFVINANRTVKSYWIQVRGLGECSQAQINQLATLQYEGTPKQGISRAPTFFNGLPRGILYNPLYGYCTTPNAETISPMNIKSADIVDREILKIEPDILLSLPMRFHFFEDHDPAHTLFGSNHYPTYFVAPIEHPIQGIIDNIHFRFPSAPPISQKEGHEYFCTGLHSDYCNRTASELPCACTHIRHIPIDSVVEVLIYDQIPRENLIHVFHLHGTNFYVLDIGRFPDLRNITKTDMKKVMDIHRKRLKNNLYDQPSKKDSILVPQGGWVIFRYKAKNPGYWLLHCHMDWHSTTGMQMIFHVGSSSDLPPVPSGFPTCGSFKAPLK